MFKLKGLISTTMSFGIITASPSMLAISSCSRITLIFLAL